MKETVIELKKVYKEFEIDHSKANSVKSLFTGLLKKQKDQSNIQRVLKGIDIEVKKGEFLGIVGRNGSGKSTLLKILAGIYKPTKGHIRVDGKLVPFIELGVGFNPELTGKENVYLNGAMLGFTRKEINEMYEEIVDFSGLEQHMNKQLKNYSSGMQVRLAFSIAIRSKADILLIDEVLAVGDSAFQKKCFDYFNTLKRDEKTVVFVSHDMSAVRYYCDRVILLNEGKVSFDGSPETAADKYLDVVSLPLGEKSLAKKSVTGKIAKIEKFNIKIDKKSIHVNFYLTANVDIEDGLLGFRIYNLENIGMIGVNSSMLGHKPVKLKKGGKYIVNWSIDNSLPAGEYRIDGSLMSFDGSAIYGKITNATEKPFVVSKDASPFPIVPHIDLEVKNGNL